MRFTSANTCCCFDLKTGGLLIGYFELVLCFYKFFAYPVFSYGFMLGLLSLVLVVPWLYGIYENKYTYMLPNLIYSVIKNAVICIGFVIFTIGAVVDLGSIDSIYRDALVENSVIMGNRIIQIDEHSPEFEDGLNAVRNFAGGLIFLAWFIFAICTAINWYFTVVMISLYKLMKADSLEQQPFCMAQDLDFVLYPKVPQTDSFEFIEITK